MEEKKFDIIKHALVPKHIKLKEEEKQELLKKYNISDTQLPMIKSSDPAIQNLDPKTGEIIKIIRKSPTNIETEFYRVVVHG